MRTLTATEMEDDHFLPLLQEAAGQDDDELRALIAGDLRAMSVVGAFHSSSLAAFAAYRATDDAVEFYRRLDFRISRRGPDPRWPQTQRHTCLLDSL